LLLRIDANFRTAGLNGRAGTSRTQDGAIFQPAGAEGAKRAANAAPAMRMTALDAILTLQCVDDALNAPRKKAVRRGQGLLDGLEAVRADLLVGRVSPDRLDDLMALVAEAREQTLPGLDALLDDIELRVRVELAKFGRYPAF
jgi:hypothetical protein